MIKVYSKVFENGKRIDKKYTCDGHDVSPPVAWDPVSGASAYALIVEDPDAPMGTFVHWVIYNIKGKELPEGVDPASQLGVQGVNDFGRIGYGGPCPPKGHGVHRYFFRVYALKSELPVQKKVTAQVLRNMMQGQIIDQGETYCVYSR